MTITLKVAVSQVETQVERHRANALLRALRRGPVLERNLPAWRASAKPPNAPVNLPFSPVMEELRQVQRRIDRLERLEAAGVPLTREDTLKLSALRREGQELVRQGTEAAFGTQPDWPFIAGLYAVRVPGLRVQAGHRTLSILPCTLFREVTVDDRNEIWTGADGLKTLLLRQSRGDNALHAPAFRLMTAPPARTLQRDANLPKRCAAWLVEQVQALKFDDVDQPGGDFYAEDPPVPDVYAEFMVLRNECA